MSAEPVSSLVPISRRTRRRKGSPDSFSAFKAYSDAVALFGTDLNAAGMNTIVGYVYDVLYGDSGGFPSYASAAAVLLFWIVLTITCINLMISKKTRA